jgi:hypothetical protein
MMGEVCTNINWSPTAYSLDIGSIQPVLDIEYQTYGWVWATAKENEQFYWEHKSGKSNPNLI